MLDVGIFEHTEPSQHTRHTRPASLLPYLYNLWMKAVCTTLGCWAAAAAAAAAAPKPTFPPALLLGFPRSPATELPPACSTSGLSVGGPMVAVVLVGAGCIWSSLAGSCALLAGAKTVKLLAPCVASISPL